MSKIYGQLEKAQLENAAADLTPASTGLAYWNTVLVAPRVYDGSAWQTIAMGSTANPTANIRASEGAGTTTLTAADTHTQRFDLSAGRIVKLPTTSISKGDIWRMVNPNPYTLTIQASDASLIATSWGDDFTIVALVNTPVANTDWAVINKNILYARIWTAYTPTFNNLGSITVQTFAYRREGANLQIKGVFTIDAPSGAASAEIGLPQPGSGLNIDITNLVNHKSSLGDWKQLGTAELYLDTLAGILDYSGGAGTQFMRLCHSTSAKAYEEAVANGFLSGTFPVDITCLNIPIAEWKES